MTTFLAGEELTADYINARVGLRKVAASNQSATTNSATLVTDTELTFAVTSGELYILRAFIVYRASAAADFKFAFSIPAGTLHWTASKLSTADALEFIQAVDLVTTDASNNAGGAAASASRIINISGSFMPSASGTLAFRFASATATLAEAASRRAGSWLELISA